MNNTEQLQDLATRLKEKSDSINATIIKFQDRINSLNLELEVWLAKDDLWEMAGCFLEHDIDGDTEKYTYLGYCLLDINHYGLVHDIRQDIRLDDLHYSLEGNYWGLAVKHHERREAKTPYGIFTRNKISGPSPLLEAPRDVRIAAISQFPNLIKELKQETSACLRTIEDVNKTAASL